MNYDFSEIEKDLDRFHKEIEKWMENPIIAKYNKGDKDG
jgi:hypothetical protein